MGAIADALLSFGEPLLAATDGSSEQMQKALEQIQLCWNLALEPEHTRRALLAQMQAKLSIPEDEMTALKAQLGPMIERHRRMFPGMHRGEGISALLQPGASRTLPKRAPEKYPGSRRTRPCPCGSGKKYKHCCLAERG